MKIEISKGSVADMTDQVKIAKKGVKSRF